MPWAPSLTRTTIMAGSYRRLTSEIDPASALEEHLVATVAKLGPRPGRPSIR